MDLLFLSFLFDCGLDVAVAIHNIDAVLGEMFHFQDFVLVVVLSMVEHLAQLILFDLHVNSLAINWGWVLIAPILP